MYRFDQVPVAPGASQHNMDEILLLRTPKLPTALPPFDQPEPKKDGSLLSLQAHQLWETRKQDYEQSDWAQWSLYQTKLSAADATITGTFSQLEATVAGMRALSETVREEMDKVTDLSALRKAVGSVPNKVRDLARQLQDQTGIKIREESVKLTPAFMRRLLREAAKEAQPGYRRRHRPDQLMLGGNLVTGGPNGVQPPVSPLQEKHGVGVSLQKAQRERQRRELYDSTVRRNKTLY
ncbi:hypothetical protein M427DRAFT_370467 [Gonapodya prolifera JEL478]|uniref:Uncharacterized protein n=1 Tax=Gonapodya prolifera (strain JEL478) TaxID=1344416 RepID=A0A139A953_GONPJ|nr:hypothetical protein M427DRAFT_370467 [Gonapodya prolifera JEL478]|eukprot:KXS13352.1 hypothetical protein M427DRAFT_370467 [Gonapodya prolifera JEL478]